MDLDPNTASNRRPTEAAAAEPIEIPIGRKKSATISPPFPWSTNRRATVHSLDYLLSNEITTITGDVKCKKCERLHTMDFELKQKFNEIGLYIAQQKPALCQRAPKTWLDPTLPGCRFCGQENSVRPVISEKKRSINWLFLLLGQMVGLCTLDQLKYFCKHTDNHRTGAKDRVLYLTYLGLCKQLCPGGPFDLCFIRGDPSGNLARYFILK
ncbi:hypothetical protein DH2020_023835 [Rehmannia glutinosa]|uniref:DUF7086 domain-containing protein n=1 Tax=Rehmannia glutinosa TaxID=99300 RepID=A0ABR0WB27_REHGL